MRRAALAMLACATSVAATAAVFALGSGPVAAQQAGVHEVDMKDFLFMPDKITITAGETIKWVYAESATDPMPNCETVVLSTQCPGHTATAVDKGPDGKPVFNSGTLKGAGKSYSFTFSKAGTYAYYCVYHGGTTQTGKNNPLTNMNGTVVVEAASTEPTAVPLSGAGTNPAVAGQQQARSGAGGELARTGVASALPWALAVLAAGLWLAGARARTRPS